jgi:hypothetical protein
MKKILKIVIETILVIANAILLGLQLQPLPQIISAIKLTQFGDLPWKFISSYLAIDIVFIANIVILGLLTYRHFAEYRSSNSGSSEING